MKRFTTFVSILSTAAAIASFGCVNILGDDFEKVGHPLHENDGDGGNDQGGSGPGPSGAGGVSTSSSTSAASSSASSSEAAASSASSSSVAGSSAAASSSSSSAASSSAASSSAASSSSGGGGTCDTQPTCADCQDCAFAGACSDETDACLADADCVALVDCLDPCTTQACDTACFNAHPSGAAIYDTLAVCVICDECPITCDGPGSGCP